MSTSVFSAGLICIILILAVVLIVRLNRYFNKRDPRVHPELDGGIFDVVYDETHRLSNVLALTWEYFDSHPVGKEVTELHYEYVVNGNGEDMSCQISRRITPSGDVELLVLFALPEGITPSHGFQALDDNRYQIALKDCQRTREGVASMIKSVMRIGDNTQVPFQLAGSDGPDHYFTWVESEEKNY